jgi:hypothetical protein
MSEPTKILSATGTQRWYLDGKLHRLDGPAWIRADGSQSWYQNGKRHRLDGPAVISAYGTQHWFQNGELHREDGPAVIKSDGTQEWYLRGVNYVSLKNWLFALDCNDKTKTMLLLKWGGQ